LHPVLFSLGPVTLHTYGALIVAGFLIGIFLIRKKAVAAGISPDDITDICFWGLIYGLIFGRILYIVTAWDHFSQNPLNMIKFWEGGLVYYGGVFGGVGAFYYFSKKKGVDILDTLDMAAPSLSIAHFFGRLGCFSAGCCYGIKADKDHPFAVVFSHAQSIAPTEIPLHPTQLYDAANAIIIFVIISLLYKIRKFKGQVIGSYFLIYAIGRSIVESYRGDSIRGFVIQDVLSTSQFISFFTFLGALVLFIYGWKKHPLKK
jgi:phosphatidylglycerol---prolipoprotein diacylglyceryl transferase